MFKLKAFIKTHVPIKTTIVFFIWQVWQFVLIVCCLVEVVGEEVFFLNFVPELKCRFHFIERQRN